MAEQLRSFLRIKQVKAVTGMSRSWIYDEIQHGRFPAPISLGARAVAWDSADIADWQAHCIERRSLPATVQPPPIEPRIDQSATNTSKNGRPLDRLHKVAAGGE